MAPESGGTGGRCGDIIHQGADMEVLQKIFIAAALIFVVGGLVWFIFIAH